MHADDDEHVLELGLEVGDKGQSAGLLEDEGDDVVADVTLTRQLLPVVGCVGQERGHVKHELVARVLGVDAVQARGVVWKGGKTFL